MIAELPESTFAEVASLADDLDALITRKPRTTVTPYEERRYGLLSAHLGREVKGPLEPLPCIGDSNTMFFAGAERLRFIRYRRSAFWKPFWINRGLDLLPCFRVFHVGPATAWKAGDYGSSTFPFIGSWELRRDITYAFIERLREHCGRLGIPFLALAGKYHPPMEKAERFLFHDGTHLSQRLMPLALEELQKAGVLKL